MAVCRVLLTALMAAALQERDAPEYEIKAAFLYNFAAFVEWPPTAFADKDSPFVVGVIGDDPFGPALEKTFRGKSVAGRPITVKRSRNVKELGACHLAFLPGGSPERSAKALESLKGTSTLTVGEHAGFAAMGGCLNFFVDGKKVRFEYNPAAAKRAQLQVSSKLLRLARVVEGQ